MWTDWLLKYDLEKVSVDIEKGLDCNRCLTSGYKKLIRHV